MRAAKVGLAGRGAAKWKNQGGSKQVRLPRPCWLAKQGKEGVRRPLMAKGFACSVHWRGDASAPRAGWQCASGKVWLAASTGGEPELPIAGPDSLSSCLP